MFEGVKSGTSSETSRLEEEINTNLHDRTHVCEGPPCPAQLGAQYLASLRLDYLIPSRRMKLAVPEQGRRSKSDFHSSHRYETDPR
jgi:hypothetical protein